MSLARIRSEIRLHGPIPFARFMELALYDEASGYYATSAVRVGPAGDFITASDAGRAFGRCLARQLAELDGRAGPYAPFDYVEIGAGRGYLARDVLDAMREIEPSLAPRLRMTLVDRSAAMRAEAARQVPEATVVESVAPEDRSGVVVAVELFDALPVHRLRRHEGAWREIYVDEGEAGLVEIEGSATAEAVALAERYAEDAIEGAEIEVAPVVESVLDAMCGAIAHGLLIIVDYGDRAADLYAPSRGAGTLLAYRSHQTSTEWLAAVGEQDLTAHVNFSHLADGLLARGARVLGLTSQDRFLLSNGLLEEFESASDQRWHEPREVKRRLQALQLIHPAGMGRAFKVMIAARGIEADSFAGLRDPFVRASHGG